jgi:hypothetical protein
MLIKNAPDLSHLKLYSPGFQAIDWGFGYDQCVDLDTALQQPCSIAVLPVYYNRKTEFSYRHEYDTIPIERFDLVLFTDIEWRSQQELTGWIETTGVENWLLHVAGHWLDESMHPRVIYNPVWKWVFLRWARPCSDFPIDRPLSFDCFLGARRAHRDFVMLSMQKNNLLNQGIVTYRDVFVGHWIDQTPPNVAQQFPGLSLQYPYVSDNLDPTWEVKAQVDNTVSQTVPWEIYNRTWFSVICESLCSGRIFLAAEKVSKCLHARRLFVLFGIQHYLRYYQQWGFETFGDVIDESYDNIENDIQRWAAAFEQVKYLCNQDLKKLIPSLKPKLDHNHHRHVELYQEKRQQMHQLIADHLK